MRVFQFKILHNILYTNDKLFKMRQVETELCTFCQTAVETPVHIFIVKTLKTLGKILLINLVSDCVLHLRI